MTDVGEEATAEAAATINQEEGSVSEASNIPVAEETSHTPEPHSQTKNKRPPRRPAKDRDASKNRNFKQNDNGENIAQNGDSNAGSEVNDKDTEKQEGEDSAPKRPLVKPYRNPIRHLTGGTPREKLTPEELAERMERIRANNEKIKERRAAVEADMQAFEASQAAQREKEARQRHVQSRVDASRAANAQRKMAKVSRREWDFEKESAHKGAPAARTETRAEAQTQSTTDDATAWDAKPDDTAWDIQPQADESAWGITSETPVPEPTSNGDAPRGRGRGRGRGQGRGRGERGEARGGGRGRGRDRDRGRKSEPVEHVDNNSWAQSGGEANAGADASAEWGISEPSWAIEKTAEPAPAAAAEVNEWEASAGDESAWGIAS